MTGQRSFIVERTVDGGEDELVEQFVTQLYGEDSENQEEAGVPQNVIVSQLPPNVEVLTSWLSAKRGAKVRISVPSRGAKRDLWRQSVRTPESHLPCTSCAGPVI